MAETGDSSNRHAQIAIRARGSNKCPEHQGKEVVFVCKDCNGNLACVSCVTTTHKLHVLEELADVIPEVKTKIQKYVRNIENIGISEVSKRLSLVEKDIAENKIHTMMILSSVKGHEYKMKQNMEKAISNVVHHYTESEKENDVRLQDYKTVLEKQLRDLKDKITDLNIKIEKGTDVELYDMSSEIPDVVNVSISKRSRVPMPKYAPPDFSPGVLTQILLGKTSIAAAPHLQYEYKPISTFSDGSLYRINIHPSNDEECLIQSGSRTICPISKVGLIQGRDVATNNDITDFCISNVTGDIWLCCNRACTVHTIAGGSSSVAFKTENEPLCITMSSDDNVLIGEKKQVIKYSNTGKVLSRSRQNSVKLPHRICECPKTGNVAVVDWDYTECGGEEKPHILILNHKLQPVNRYYGEILQDNCFYGDVFDPNDVCYDKVGNLVIADSSMSIIALNSTGHFIGVLSDLKNKKVTQVCVHRNGDIWAVFYEREVVILRKS